MSQEIELLTEIRDLLQVIAEPEIAKRDEKRRSSLRTVVGSTEKRKKAALLMDGTRSQSALSKEAGLDPSRISRLVKGLADAKLIAADQKQPKLLVKVPANFFDGNSNES